jgi:hypothetical protein
MDFGISIACIYAVIKNKNEQALLYYKSLAIRTIQDNSFAGVLSNFNRHPRIKFVYEKYTSCRIRRLCAQELK